MFGYVWLCYNNIILHARIYEIKVIINTGWEKQIHNGINNLDFVYYYKIFIEDTRCNNEMEDWFSGSELFNKKEELLEYLERNIIE